MSDLPLLYEFGSFRINTSEGLLLSDGRPVPLTPKAFETLLALVERSGHVVNKARLMERVWPDSFVEENNLTQNISFLRKTLQQIGGDECARYIETVPKRGYRFNAHVVVRREETLAPPPPEPKNTGSASRVQESQLSEELLSASTVSTTPKSNPAQPPPASVNFETRTPLGSPSHRSAALFPEDAPETKYARSGEVNIAYQVVGAAPLDLVFVMGWVSHLEYFWREPSFARFLRRLASFSRLILFDKRGTGLSDKVPLDQLPTLEQRLDDVRAVLDAVGSERAAILGISEGGPMSAMFAATYPEKVTALVMIGTYAKRLWHPDYPWAPTVEARERFLHEIQEHWGGPVGLAERAPTKADDPAFRDWWATYLRMGASPGAAVALTRMNAEIDVRNVLPLIRLPSLILHRTGDKCLKAEEGRYVASLIPQAKYVELPGADHLPFVGDQDALIDEIEEFLTGVRHRPEPESVLATVLFLHIVQPEAGEATDDESSRRRSDLLGRLQAHVRKEIKWFRGREIDMEGRGPLATFDGPVRAVRCACAIREYAERLGFSIRAGLHTGECDLLDDDIVTGLAVEIAAAVRAKARAGELLVSSTVKDLIAGSGVKFSDYGLYTFAGVSGEWRLFNVGR